MTKNRVLTREEREKYFPDLIVFRRSGDMTSVFEPGVFYRWKNETTKDSTDQHLDPTGGMNFNGEKGPRDFGPNSSWGFVYERLDINFPPEGEENANVLPF